MNDLLNMRQTLPSLAADSLAEVLNELRAIRNALAECRLDDRLAIDAKGLATTLGISERLVWTMHSTAELPEPFRCGKRTLWDVAELKGWMAAGRPLRREWQQLKHCRKAGT